ncbi:hypothetical protein KIN20_002627 [Parelaphostrongylus tenuis]|uniref:E3 ubiquitin-protein ligase RBBP6 n=1 Tax=Parelaphostrongylus tenuis TaxID=148309 RepID=A0AAD5QDN5_PARTN|nr:hypothetical protein KIN20_002627 [Parelaphostrongylus tenuis]
MSSIHYKFRATLEYKTLQFDGLHITGADLKKEICSKEGIKAEAFDLLLQNAHTKRSYTAEELIPRNSSIIVQRVPREDAEKLPKIQGVNTGVVVRSSATETGVVAPAPMSTEEFEKLSEEDQIAHIKDVSTAKYHSSNFQKKTTNIMSGPPPPTYTCNRCYQPGHWYKKLPNGNHDRCADAPFGRHNYVSAWLATKRTTGIPSQELMETTPEDPLAMLHPSGKLVVPIMHWKARQHTKKVTEEVPTIERVPPQELTCPICSHLLKDAVLTTCCGHSFCADCISNKLMESPDRQCPGKNCDQKQLSVDSLVPNKTVRQAALAWSTGASGSGSHEHEPVRFRIGLQPAVVSSTSTPPPTLTAAVSHTLTPTTSTISLPTDSLLTQNPTTTFTIAPPVPPSVPTSFSHPPPNMLPGVSASSSSSGDSLLPRCGTTSVPPPSLSLPMTHAIPTNSTLPPIPGVGLPLQTQMLVPPGTGQPTFIFNQPPPVSTINLGPPQPQIMDAWDAFLHRKDRERERPRRRGRSRIRSSSSSSSFSSGDDRRKRRDRHDREKRRDQRSDKQRDRDRARDSRYRRGEERGNRERDRDRGEWNDRHRENRLQRTVGYSSRIRDGKEESSLPSLMGLDVTTPPNLNPICEKRDRSRSRSKTPPNVHSTSGIERRKRKKKDSRWKNEPNWRFRKSERERKSRKTNETDDAAREMAEEEAIDGALREIAEFVRVEANCDDDGIEFDIEEAVVKDTVTEAEDERSVTDTDPPPDEAANPPAERMSGAENEEPVEHHQSESEDVEVPKEDTTETDKPKDVEEKAEEVETKDTSRKKDKKHKKHKKHHKKQREGDDDISSESKHRHKRRKEKKEKKRKEKKHRRDKNYESDERVKHEHDKEPNTLLEETEAKHARSRDGTKNYSEERRASDSVSQRKSDDHNGVRDSRKHHEKDKSELGKRREEKEGGRSRRERDRSRDKRHGDKVHEKDTHRNRSRERDTRKSKDHSSKRRSSDSNVDRASETRPREDRKGEYGLKVHSEKHEKTDRLSERSRTQSQRSDSNLCNSREHDHLKSTDAKLSQFITKEPQSEPLRDVEPSGTRKQKAQTTVANDDEPLEKKQKTDVAAGSSSSTPVKSVPVSMVKFRVKAPPVLKLSAVDKESTDIEEDKTKLPADDNSGVGDPRMREAFSPPKLQRKKITLNL